MWNANTEADLAGYKVYYGTAPRSYQFSLDVGNQTSYTVTGLGLGTYYFAVTAYDSSGNESGFSAEVSKSVADTTPPVISGILATGVTSSSATIHWSTDEPATTQVEYGTTTAYGASTPLNSSLVTSHSQPLSGLQPSTLYHYRVWSVDAAGNVAVSADNTVTTLATPDTTPPVISGVMASNITSNGAVITWTTNEASTTQVDYGLTAGYGSSTPLDSALVTSHSQTLSGLTASTLYHYRVKSRDAAGNLATSGDFTFVTFAAPDTTAPVISNVAAGDVSSSGATITWTTNEAATSQVEYGTTTAYGSSTAISTTLVTNHSRILSGLQPSTLYHYRARSADGANNLTVSGDWTFTTDAAPDNMPPQNIQNFIAVGADRYITLNWNTPPDPDFLGVRIRYLNDRFPVGINDGVLLGDFTSQPNASISATHSGLQNGVTYYYAAFSYDLQGNYQPSAVKASATPAVEPIGEPAVGGGCGSVAPWNGGSPRSGQPNPNLLLSYLLLVVVGLLKWVRHLPAWLRQCTPGISQSRLMLCARWFVALGLWLTLSPSVWAGSATLSWLANPEGDVSGYNLYYGTSSRSYGPPLDVGNQLSVSVSGLTEGAVYYFAVTAYDMSGNESNFSAEVSKVIDSSGGVPPPNPSSGVSGGGGCGRIRLIGAAPPRLDLSLLLLMSIATVGFVGSRARLCAVVVRVPGERCRYVMGQTVGIVSQRVWQVLAGVLFVAVVGFTPASAWAAPPVILYTDIVSGPNTGGENNNGTYLSIFGKNFGASQSASTVSINNVEVAAYKYWGPSLGRADIQQITVQPGPSVTSGSIRVVVGGVGSNTDHAFTVRSGKIWFLSLSGNDETCVAGDITKPCRHLQNTYDSKMAPGDFVVIRGGHWTDIGRGGGNWIRADKTDATASTPFAFMGYPGEAVVYDADQLAGCPKVVAGYTPNEPVHRNGMWWSNLVNETCTDATFQIGRAGSEVYDNWVRLVNIKIIGSGCDAAGTIEIDRGNNLKVYGIYIDDNRPSCTDTLHHQFYFSYRTTNAEVGWMEFVNGSGGGTFQIRATDNATEPNGVDYHTNISVHDSIWRDSPTLAAAWAQSTGPGMKFYNNVIYNSGWASYSALSGLRIRDVTGSLDPAEPTLELEIYNNVLYMMNGNNQGCFGFEGGAKSVMMRNNICVVASGDNYFTLYNDFNPAAVTADHNVWFGSSQALPDWLADASDVKADPLFVSPGAPARNFRLQSGSPARDAGFNTAILRDPDGVPRPQGAAYDIGAFEYDLNNPPPPADTTPPSAPTGLSVQ